MKNDDLALTICYFIAAVVILINLYIFACLGVRVGSGFREAYRYRRWVYTEWRKRRKVARCD